MRVTIVRDDNLVGVDGLFRTVDLSGVMPAGVRVIQWNENVGHAEYYDENTANTLITLIAEIQPYIDLWTAAAPPPPTDAERIAAAHARINVAYEIEVALLTADYPQTEIESWPKQETEARAWLADNAASTPWLRGSAAERGINIPNLAALIIQKADELAPLQGAATGKRQRLRDQINALGATPTQEQLDAIQW